MLPPDPQRGAQLHIAVGAYDVMHLCITRLGLACCTYVRNRQQLFRHNGYMYHYVSPCDTHAIQCHVYSMYTVFSWFLVPYLGVRPLLHEDRSGASEAYRRRVRACSACRIPWIYGAVVSLQRIVSAETGASGRGCGERLVDAGGRALPRGRLSR